MNRLSESVTSISDTARQWAKNEIDRIKAGQTRLSSQSTWHHGLAGFIGEAVVREYLVCELLLKAEHGPLYGNDIIVENEIGVEVKTQTSLYKWKPTYWAWAPGYKPNGQHALIYTWIEVEKYDEPSVLKADKLRLRGWISDAAASKYEMLTLGSATPMKEGDMLAGRKVLQIPDADLCPMVDFVRFCFP